jgi:hypothetical protein
MDCISFGHCQRPVWTRVHFDAWLKRIDPQHPKPTWPPQLDPQPFARIGRKYSPLVEWMPSRRFPLPWSVEEQTACFVVRDHNGQAPTYVYFEDEPGRRSAAKLHPRTTRMAFLTMLWQCRHADTGALPNNPILKFPVGCTIQNVRKVSARNGHKWRPK